MCTDHLVFLKKNAWRVNGIFSFILLHHLSIISTLDDKDKLKTRSQERIWFKELKDSFYTLSDNKYKNVLYFLVQNPQSSISYDGWLLFQRQWKMTVKYQLRNYQLENSFKALDSKVMRISSSCWSIISIFKKSLLYMRIRTIHWKVFNVSLIYDE